MSWHPVWSAGKHLAVQGLQCVEVQLKRWTQPAPDQPILGIATDLFRSKQELIAENDFLCQQVIMLKRQQTGRPSITPHDR